MQRAFGVRRSGKPKQIWEFTPAGTELKLIKKTAAEDGFYSEPAPVGASTLDEQITDLETPLSRRLAALRTLPAGTIADPATAAELVSHLAPRTSHLRSVFTKGMTGLLDGAIEVFGDADNVKRLFGFDGDGPSDLLTDLLRPTLKKDPRFALFVQLGLPEPVLEQMAFRIGKEHFDSTFGAGFGDIAAGLSRVRAQAEGQAREGHNTALGKLLEKNLRHDDLLAFVWSVETAPTVGAVLPDCVALGLREEGLPCPYMTAGRDELVGIIMPLSTGRLLVGRRPDTQLPQLDDYNVHAAACSHHFFLANANKPEWSALVTKIGERSTAAIDEALDDVLSTYRAATPVTVADETLQVVPVEVEEAVSSGSKPFGYEISLPDWGDQATADHLATVLKVIVGELSQVIPLERLDGITFAADMAAGAATIDLGRPGKHPPELNPEESERALAMNVTVIRDGVVKCRLLLAAGVGAALIEDDHPSTTLALHRLVHQLVLVTHLQWFDEAFPGLYFTHWEDQYEGALFAHVGSALDNYGAARVAGIDATVGFGDAVTCRMHLAIWNRATRTI